LIAGLKRWGVRPGQKDVVCLHAFNDIMYSMLFLGTIGAGGIFAGTNPGYTPYELVHHTRTADVKYLITEPETLQSILAAAKECNISKSNILIFNVNGQPVPQGFQSWDTLLDKGKDDWLCFDNLQTAKDTEAVRLFSSGTTGLPKATMISHYNLVAQHTICWNVDRKDYDVRRLLCLPMFHAAVFPVAHTTTLKAGHASYVLRRFELEGFLQTIENYQITDLIMVPPIVIATIMSDLTDKYSLKSLRAAVCGAAALGIGPQKRFQQLMSANAPFTQVWGERPGRIFHDKTDPVAGMTELSCLATRHPYPEHDDTGSIGRALPNIDTKCVYHPVVLCKPTLTF
jgi:4-coumarate--CoA ligase